MPTAKLLKNTYSGEGHLTPDEIRSALAGNLEGFKFFFEHCCEIQDRDTRKPSHLKLNRGQEMIADAILKRMSRETRTDTHQEIVICAPRQIGKSTVLSAIGNYAAAYVSGMEHLNIVHTLQVGGAADKFYRQKLEPLITSVHPDIYCDISKSSLGTSNQLHYHTLKGVERRDSYYEILSANSNSVRSGTVSVWLADEPSEYRDPYMVQDAISGAISDYGYSLTAYIGTFSDRLSNYFLEKIQLGVDNPEAVELVFIPWFLVYGKPEDGVNFTTDMYDEYDTETVIPEMRKYGLTEEEQLYKIAWYHKRRTRTSNMKYEFPSSVDDLMSLAASRGFFDEAQLKKQDELVLPDTYYRIVTDTVTRQPEAQKTDLSAFKIFKPPVLGGRYRLVVDAITATSDNSDFFSMMVFDERNNEQVAVFNERGLDLRDYADYAVQICKIYNRAMIVPEKNMAEAFIALVMESFRYYNFYYATAVDKKNRTPGIRTTASSRDGMLKALVTLLENNNIIIHDAATLEEMRHFIRKVKKHTDGSESVRVEAASGWHDDRVMNLAIYCGSLDRRQLAGQSSVDFLIL